MNARELIDKVKNGEPVFWEEYPPQLKEVIERRAERELSTEEELE